MLKIPSVDDWFRLTLKYHDYPAGDMSLKHYGYMAIMDYLDTHNADTILEFGHGFKSILFERYGATRQVWGVDDWQGLSYFPFDRDEWERRFDEEVRSKAPGCRFQRGLLGSNCKADLPENFFDVVCSVSVLEEVNIDVVRDILKHAARLLKPGGVLIGTHDLLTSQLVRIGEYTAAHAEAGLDLQDPYPAIDLGNRTLLESPVIAMLQYQAHEGESRKYWGHWTVMWTVATKW